MAAMDSIKVKIEPDVSEFKSVIGSLEPIKMRGYPVLPTWITAAAAVGIFVLELLR